MEITPPVPSILILKADRLCGEALRRAVGGAVPAAQVTLAHSVAAAETACETRDFDLVISGVSLPGDTLDFLAALFARARPPHSVLVVSTHFDWQVLNALRELGVRGVFDAAAEPPENFAAVLLLVLSGRRYWSQNLGAQLSDRHAPHPTPAQVLTVVEQLALAVLGDGCDDEAAARILHVSPATAATLRRDLHRKLGVQHRGELVRTAAQCGFVRFTQAGVVRPGFSLLLAAYKACQRRRQPAAA